MIINLETLEGLPQLFLDKLQKFNDTFTQYDFMEYLVENKKIFSLIIELNDYISKNKIVGYHYTRTDKNEILEKGLLSRTGKEIRETFEKKYFHLFTKDEIQIIKNAWQSRFNGPYHKLEKRDNLVFFNFTKDALSNSSSELLLKCYGGEQIYFPLFGVPQIKEKLNSIGVPMIIQCNLNPNIIKTHIEYPWGKIAVSSYHRRLNPNAQRVDQDGNQTVSVDPKDITIIKLNKGTYC